MPRGARRAVEAELDRWAALGVDGHFADARPARGRARPLRATHGGWLDYHVQFAPLLADLVGARPDEVVAMNTLTVNLHLMLATFFRPTAQRFKILIERDAFSSDRYAVESQLRWHGLEPKEALLELGPRPGGFELDRDRYTELLEAEGERIALVLLPGVQYRTGQAFDFRAITEAAHRKGCLVGFDLAHAAGNLALKLHDSGCDFAVWCSYKYLNSGPGAVAGCFVHERHARTDRPRFAGWWGHDQESRFRMGPDFVPTPGADGWQLSNPPILALAPLRVSLAIFRRAGMDALRSKSIALTGYFESLLRERLDRVLEIATPREPERRGCQLSLRVRGGRDEGRALFDHLNAIGIVVDWREPDVIRAAPTPLYNRRMDCLRLVREVETWAGQR
jgi:kynureninase